MKNGTILNKELSEAVASMGHGDMMIVSDAGFPIPNDTWRVDLAVKRDLPRLETVLEVLSESLIPETISYAQAISEYNPELEKNVKDIFDHWAPEYKPVEHETLLENYSENAKVIVRTGAFNPWGNIALISGVDPRGWFDKDGVKTPEDYRTKIERLKNMSKDKNS